MQWYYTVKHKTRRLCVILINRTFAWVIWTLEGKVKNGKMNGDSGTTPYRKETLHIAAPMTSMRNPNLYRCISQTLICFNPTLNCQRVTQMMLHCVNLLDSSAFLQMKRYLSTPLGNWKVYHRSLILYMIKQKTLESRFSLALVGLIIGGIPQGKRRSLS